MIGQKNIIADGWSRHMGGCILFYVFLALLLLPTASVFGAVKIVGIKFLFNITGDFKEPSDVAVSKDGKIYVVDGVNGKIKVFTSNGNAYASFGETGERDGQFKFPLGIDVDDSGKIYVADSGNHRVEIFDRDAGFISGIDVPGRGIKPADPTDVAVDETRNRLYVVDNDNHRYLAYDLSTLKLINTVGEPGEQELMFRYPFLIALNKEGYLNIVDVINTRIQVISPDGLFVTYVGGWGVEAGEFFRPKGVAVDRNDRIYVSDSYMGVIQVFDSWGELYGVLGNADTNTIMKFKTPVGLYIDDRDRLYVVEMLANRVSVYGIETKGN
jgi:DNA-binding beta-propeller fold protein YncE